MFLGLYYYFFSQILAPAQLCFRYKTLLQIVVKSKPYYTAKAEASLIY